MDYCVTVRQVFNDRCRHTLKGRIELEITQVESKAEAIKKAKRIMAHRFNMKTCVNSPKEDVWEIVHDC